MQSKIAALFCAFFILFFIQTGKAQNDQTFKLTKFSLEARADFDYFNTQNSPVSDTTPALNEFGFNGKYFNLLLGGDLGHNFSFFFRQRIIARPGSVSLFDNTDFLYVQYQFHPRWRVRLGKEALPVGGFEYDAPPINVYYYTQYWNDFYCFQIGASLSYTDAEEHNTLTLHVGNSPYVRTAADWKKGLIGFNFLWNGNYKYFKTLYSFNLYRRTTDNQLVSFIALGNQFTFDKVNWYVDFVHKTYDFSEWFKYYLIVSRLDVKLYKGLSLFAKGGYEYNMGDDFWTMNFMGEDISCLGSNYFYGLGLEYSPVKAPGVRLHGYVALANMTDSQTTIERKSRSINANVGVTWKIDFLKFFKKYYSTQSEKN
ncbi:MAG: OprO/OprP family phosphate-selective porin [Bacteroidales bacterium]|nr:OprO/OprP family phosphate-selective porin [Bacteroidales bacterium]